MDTLKKTDNYKQIHTIGIYKIYNKKDLLNHLSNLIDDERPIFIGSRGQEKQFIEYLQKHNQKNK